MRMLQSFIFCAMACLVWSEQAHAQPSSVGNGYHERPTYNDEPKSLDMGGQCQDRSNEHDGGSCVVRTECTDVYSMGIKVGETCEDIMGREDYNSNLCNRADWWNYSQCYLTSYFHDVAWYKACPKGQLRQSNPNVKYQVYAIYDGHGIDYDDEYPDIEVLEDSNPNMVLHCTDEGSADGDHGLNIGGDFGAAKIQNRQVFSRMGCETWFDDDGRWTRARGALTSPPTGSAMPGGPIPTDCLGDTNLINAQASKWVCRPGNCDLITGKNCEILQGYYNIYIKVSGLQPSVCNADPPEGCPAPAFESDDPRHCSNKPGGCVGENNICEQGARASYYTGMSQDGSCVPPEQLCFGAVTMRGMKQPIYNNDGSVDDPAMTITQFDGASSPIAPYFTDEMYPGGLYCVDGDNPGGTIKVGRTPLMVRSMACPKLQDGYTPLQNVRLGQKRLSDARNDDFMFNDYDHMRSVARSEYDDIKAKVATYDAYKNTGDSCDLVEDVASELKDYNIFNEGQYSFAAAHAISTAANQLVEDNDKNKIPVLTIAMTEPLRNCFDPDNPTTSQNLGSKFKDMFTKWSSYDNWSDELEQPGDKNMQGRYLDSRCMRDTLTDEYHQALKDAAKRVKDAGGYVIAISLNCKGSDFQDTLMDMSTGNVDLNNFAPEGVFIGGCTFAAADASGKITTHEGEIRGSNVFTMDIDGDENLLFSPVYAQGAADPLYGTLEDVYAEIAWVIMRNKIGKEVCANQNEGKCDSFEE